MMRALCIALVLGIVAGVQVQTLKTWADQGADAEKAKQNLWADQEAATEEAKRACRSGDMDAALNVLEAHGKPIGLSQGKDILKTCFIEDETGECLLGKAKCEWMKECLKSEGACAQVPIAEALLELPGGKAVLEEMQAETNSSTSAPISKLTAAAKKITMAIRGPSALMQETSQAKTGGIMEDINDANAKALNGLKKALGMAVSVRNAWFEYVPEPFQRRFALEALSLPLWARIACGTSYVQKFDDVTGKPLYGKYAPMGESGPKYTAPLYDVTASKSKDLSDWTCTYPKKLKKWQKRELAEAEAAKLLKLENSVQRPERKALRKAAKAADDKYKEENAPNRGEAPGMPDFADKDNVR